jgi:long-subunit acyl-CoA synthetase (AMP-forming)
LARTNSQLESHQKLDNIVVLKEDWTTNDFLTPTLKIKRMEIETAFQHYLEQDFSELVFWE